MSTPVIVRQIEKARVKKWNVSSARTPYACPRRFDRTGTIPGKCYFTITMDIDLISPLAIDECQKRLDAALVRDNRSIPFGIGPRKQMIGTREGPNFRLRLRRDWTGRSRYAVQFRGSFSESKFGTQVRGYFEFEKQPTLISYPIEPIVIGLTGIVGCLFAAFDHTVSLFWGSVGIGLFGC